MKKVFYWGGLVPFKPKLFIKGDVTLTTKEVKASVLV